MICTPCEFAGGWQLCIFQVQIGCNQKKYSELYNLHRDL
jgi:hypothetical protein